MLQFKCPKPSSPLVCQRPSRLGQLEGRCPELRRSEGEEGDIRLQTAVPLTTSHRRLTHLPGEAELPGGPVPGQRMESHGHGIRGPGVGAFLSDLLNEA